MTLPRREAVDADALETLALAQLRASDAWPARVEEPGLRVATGRLPESGQRAYRSDVSFARPVEDVATLIADEMVQRLGEWNEEFLEGHVLERWDAGPNRRGWLVHVFYATPGPLADREYLYVLYRHDLPDGRVVMPYQSVESDVPVRAGFVRGTLDATVHVAIPEGDHTRLEHLLVTDIGGAFPRWVQTHLLVGGIVQANVRDARRQRALLG